MPRLTPYSPDQPFTPSPESQRNGKDMPAHNAKVEKDREDANRTMNIPKGTRVLVNLDSGTVEAVLQNAYRWPADRSVVVAIVTIGDKTRRIEGSRIGPVIRTKAKGDK